MMDRVKYFENTLIRCEKTLSQDPTIIPLKWIITQLKYLINLEKGNIKDFSELNNIKIGWIATRELDGFEDKDLIH